MSFDDIIDRRGTHSSKWDGMEPIYGVSPDDGLAMWVADMDFRAPDCVTEAVRRMTDLGVYGYFGDDRAYREAIVWWMRTRHGWDVVPDHIFTTNGLVNAVALCIDAFTRPDDGVIVMTPVYHSFLRVIRAAGRRLVECPLAERDGRYEMAFDEWEAQLDGRERMLVLCSPHNPGGRVWTREELQGVADFARRHDLVIVSDEVHHDLVYPGTRHVPMAHVADASDRLVMLSATTKTFNIAGAHVGNVVIADDDLRRTFADRMVALSQSPNAFGMHMATAAYSPEGAAWLDELLGYLDGNRAYFDAGIRSVPGLRSMTLEATYLAWVDFSGTGMDRAEFTRRVERDARIAVNHGPTFGKGGEAFLRFNFAMPRAQVQDAVVRLQNAFGDLQ